MNIECWQSWHISISSPGIDHLTGDHISRIRGQWSLLSQAWPGGEWSEWKSMPGMKSIKERRVMTTRPVWASLPISPSVSAMMWRGKELSDKCNTVMHAPLSSAPARLRWLQEAARPAQGAHSGQWADRGEESVWDCHQARTHRTHLTPHMEPSQRGTYSDEWRDLGDY